MTRKLSIEYSIGDINEDGDIVVYIDADQFDNAYEFDYHPDVYRLPEYIQEIANNALDNPIYLHGRGRDDVFVINNWGTMDQLKAIAEGRIVIEVSGRDKT